MFHFERKSSENTLLLQEKSTKKSYNVYLFVNFAAEN